MEWASCLMRKDCASWCMMEFRKETWLKQIISWWMLTGWREWFLLWENVSQWSMLKKIFETRGGFLLSWDCRALKFSPSKGSGSRIFEHCQCRDRLLLRNGGERLPQQDRERELKFCHIIHNFINSNGLDGMKIDVGVDGYTIVSMDRADWRARFYAACLYAEGPFLCYVTMLLMVCSHDKQFHAFTCARTHKGTSVPSCRHSLKKIHCHTPVHTHGYSHTHMLCACTCTQTCKHTYMCMCLGAPMILDLLYIKSKTFSLYLSTRHMWSDLFVCERGSKFLVIPTVEQGWLCSRLPHYELYRSARLWSTESLCQYSIHGFTTNQENTTNTCFTRVPGISPTHGVSKPLKGDSEGWSTWLQNL